MSQCRMSTRVDRARSYSRRSVRQTLGPASTIQLDTYSSTDALQKYTIALTVLLLLCALRRSISIDALQKYSIIAGTW